MHWTPRVVVAACLSLPAAGVLGQSGPEIGVMSFNVWTAEGSSTGRSRIVTAVQAGGADIIGFQEMGGTPGTTIANNLGLFYDSQSQIATKYRILDDSFSHGVRVELAPGHEAYVFNVHLRHYFYGPYQLAGIPYVNGPLYDPNDPDDIDDVVQDQIDSRGAEIAAVLAEMQTALSSGLPVFLTGDFNEASHLDWTAAADAAGVHSAEVPWPTSIEVQNAGLTDSFRTVHTDEVATPGNTWSPVYGPDYNNGGVLEPQDRIDFVYFTGQGVTATDSQTVGPNDGLSNITTNNFPSDHRGVVTDFRLDSVKGTTLTFTQLGNDGDALDTGYADNALGTQNLALDYTTNGGEWILWAGNNWGDGVAYLDSGNGGAASGASYDLAITADPDYAAVITGFDLIDWASGDSTGQTVQWSLLDAGGSTLTSGTANVGDDDTLHIDTGLAGAVAGGITLRLVHTNGTNNELALDNVAFDQALIGDLTGDGTVDEADLQLLLGNFGVATANYNWSSGEVTGDGRVDLADLNTVLTHWSNGVPPSVNIPEPGAFAGFLLAGGLLSWCRSGRSTRS